MKNFAVIGNPAAHSKSPVIFRELFRRYGLDSNYLRICLENAADIIPIMKKYDISGVNITSPFKEDAFAIPDNCDQISNELKAINLILKRNDSFYGFNTDVYGIEHSLVNNNIIVNGKKCIVLGAGGAAKSAVYSLKELDADVFCCNRTDMKSDIISRQMNCGFIKYSKLIENLTDTYLLISAVPEISVGIRDNVRNVIILDANYRSSDLKNFCRRYINGHEWLIYQAVRSFELFFDIKADTGDLKKVITDIKPKKNIALTGHTCCGKSTYGKIIAEHYGMDFFDTDNEIEQLSGMTIREIFSTKDEEFFRKTETEAISRIAEMNNSVISVGAGALSSSLNSSIIKENCFSVLLDIDKELILSRLTNDQVSQRPLVKDVNPKLILERMFNERNQNFISTADLMISIKSNDIEKESSKIIRELDAR